MLELKPGVRLAGLRPEMLVALMAAERAFADLGADLVITSALDGRHSPTSLHYTGCAVDLRTRDLSPRDARPSPSSCICWPMAASRRPGPCCARWAGRQRPATRNGRDARRMVPAAGAGAVARAIATAAATHWSMI